ncbi:hypothetical protein [Flavobacterium sp.]|uniref:hypothetical protein n=1 Tax=Flavobacterium sp. TaxID=239 RepID=UPI0040488B60
MENIAENVELLYEKAEQYSKTSFKLLQLTTIEKTSDVISSLSVIIVISILFAMFTLFINIGISLYIGALLKNTALGFFIVSGFYFILVIAVYIFRKSLIKIPIDNLIVFKLLKEEKDLNSDKKTPSNL